MSEQTQYASIPPTETWQVVFGGLRMLLRKDSNGAVIQERWISNFGKTEWREIPRVVEE